jgi:hypothetical protein
VSSWSTHNLLFSSHRVPWHCRCLPCQALCVGHRLRDIIGGVSFEALDRGLEVNISGSQIPMASIGLRHAVGPKLTTSRQWPLVALKTYDDSSFQWRDRAGTFVWARSKPNVGMMSLHLRHGQGFSGRSPLWLRPGSATDTCWTWMEWNLKTFATKRQIKQRM